MLFMAGLPEGLAQLPEGIPDGVGAPLYAGALAIGFQKGQGAAQPPQGDQQEGQDHGCRGGKTQRIAEKNQQQAQDKGNHGADIAKGVAHGGDIVHPVLPGDFRKHGIVEYQAGGVAHLCQYVDNQKGQPASGGTEDGTAQDSYQHGDHKQLLFKAALVRQRAADGADNGNQQGGDGTGIAPEGQVLALVQAAGGGQGIEVNGNQGGYQQDKGRVAHIVENPVSLQGGKAEL